MKKRNPKESKESKRTRIQKNKESLRHLWDNFKHSNIRIIRVPEGEEEEQEIENLFEKIMKENFPNWRRKQIYKSRKHRESQTI